MPNNPVGFGPPTIGNEGPIPDEVVVIPGAIPPVPVIIIPATPRLPIVAEDPGRSLSPDFVEPPKTDPELPEDEAAPF